MDEPETVRFPWHDVLPALDPHGRLAPFDPHIAGTPPLGLDLPSSDIDILCHAADAQIYLETVWALFSAHDDFHVWQWTGRPGDDRPIVARFKAMGWEIEVFGAAASVSDQAGWRHFNVERRLLAIGGQALRDRIMALRMQGMKTEPAFAVSLGIQADPYAALLDLERASDDELSALVSAALGTLID